MDAPSRAGAVPGRDPDQMEAIEGQRRCVIIGGGRAGRSFDAALRSVGWHTEILSGRSIAGDDLDQEPAVASLRAADIVLVAVPDDAIGVVARRLAAAVGDLPGIVAHVSGASALDVLTPHARVASVHPLMSLPDATIGARRLLDRCSFAVDGDEGIEAVVTSLGGRSFSVPGERRALYHATASIAASHLVALCAQVERLARDVGIPVDAYWTLMLTTLHNVAEQGAVPSLTGPAARADWNVVRTHLDALPADERRLYLCLCERAARAAGHVVPADVVDVVDRADDASP